MHNQHQGKDNMVRNTSSSAHLPATLPTFDDTSYASSTATSTSLQRAMDSLFIRKNSKKKGRRNKNKNKYTHNSEDEERSYNSGGSYGVAARYHQNPTTPSSLADSSIASSVGGTSQLLSAGKFDIPNLSNSNNSVDSGVSTYLMSSSYSIDPMGSGSMNGSLLLPQKSSSSYNTKSSSQNQPTSDQREWLLRMNHKLKETGIGKLDPAALPYKAIMNAWAKTKSEEGANMVEMWIIRLNEERAAGNKRIPPLTTKMYTVLVDAWAKSGISGAATRAEATLQNMNQLYILQTPVSSHLKPTTAIFNAVINAWARTDTTNGSQIQTSSGSTDLNMANAAQRAEQILQWMLQLYRQGNVDVKPDKYTYNTVIHSYAKIGNAPKALEILNQMREYNSLVQPDTITYNVVINALAKSQNVDAPRQAEALLQEMHELYQSGNSCVKPNVVTYGAVIDSHAKSSMPGNAARADELLAQMIHLHQSDPVAHSDLRPNTYSFNTVINAWAKSQEYDSADKAEEMLRLMEELSSRHGMDVRPDAFTYTAVIDCWAKSGKPGAPDRAHELLTEMETQIRTNCDVKPNSFTYNAVINALAKCNEPGAAAKAERVLCNMVARTDDAIRPSTINFNTVLDAWAKSKEPNNASHAEDILNWMNSLYEHGNTNVKPDSISFNAVIDAWARSASQDSTAARRAEEILTHMDALYDGGNIDVRPDAYTYNTVINAYAKCSPYDRSACQDAERILQKMKSSGYVKPNTRSHTCVIDAWAKSGRSGAALHAERMLQDLLEGDNLVRPNTHTFNAVMNACAFTRSNNVKEKVEAKMVAFRVFDRLVRNLRDDGHDGGNKSARGTFSISNQCRPDAYTYTILLSVVCNLMDDKLERYEHAKLLFKSCAHDGCVNEFVWRKLRQVIPGINDFRTITGGRDHFVDLPQGWTRNDRQKKNHRYHNHTSRNDSRGRGGRYSNRRNYNKGMRGGSSNNFRSGRSYGSASSSSRR